MGKIKCFNICYNNYTLELCYFYMEVWENMKNVKWSDLNKSAKFFVISITLFICVSFMVLVTEMFGSEDKKPSQAPQEVKKY